jgi:hypothetical protein
MLLADWAALWYLAPCIHTSTQHFLRVALGTSFFLVAWKDGAI